MSKIPRTTTKELRALCHIGRMRATEKRWVDFGRIVLLQPSYISVIITHLIFTFMASLRYNYYDYYYGL